MWRRRLRCMSEVGALWLAIAASGSVKSGVEILWSISLLRLTSPSLKSKNVCQPMNRRGARKPLRRSAGSRPGAGVMSPSAGSKMNAKNGLTLSRFRFGRSDEERQELVQNEPVVMPQREALRLVEDLRRIDESLLQADVVDRLVVEEDER